MAREEGVPKGDGRHHEMTTLTTLSYSALSGQSNEARKMVATRQLLFTYSVLLSLRCKACKAAMERAVHILVFPFPAQGHMLPLLDLSHKLSLRAFAVAVFDHIWANYDSLKPESDLKLDDLPRSPSFPWDQLPSLLRRCKDLECRDKTAADFKRTPIAANALSWASVYNSFWALEGQFLSSKAAHQRVYSVGPLNLVDGSEKLRSGDAQPGSDDGVVSWLDGCGDGSVLYVCFGSQKLLKAAQVEALAAGHERSGVRFVWVVKNLTAQQVADGYGPVPDGFEDRVSGRGLVVKGWAPQTAILSHRAVGGFLSHCGWNSTLEAVAIGVMILGWPMEADQFVNAKLLVEYMDTAVMICEGSDTVPDPAELARKLSQSMRGCATQRDRAKDLRKQALEAVQIGGSSITDLDKLAQQLSQL
ncbi:hypothetical protein SASPL_142848 [Salvia splendens]|uniref:Uncharacterized protein n=1 Tax=Salvia splendens TaxID=180675 RepID=A0A8X8WM82_SALSN|nr:hypothetical protein SASPL_142848 [Salvia splendens]